MDGNTFMILATISGVFSMIVVIYAYYAEYTSKRRNPLLHRIAVIAVFAMVCFGGLAATNT